ncbi:MAG: tetratricopeptide repeat protein, partial [Burkholderiales bacterium]|nr:tetratricopeptide repeat protein [Burkholderiales bacterium]
MTQDPDREEFTRQQLKHYLQAASRREILVRMLRNLKFIYANDAAWAKILPVLQRLAILEPDNELTIRDRGFAFANLDCPKEALADLQLYLRVKTDALDSFEIRAMLPALEAQLKRD